MLGNRICTITNIAIVFFSLQYLLPIFIDAETASRTVFFASMVNSLTWFLFQVGRPPLSLDWWKQWFRSPVGAHNVNPAADFQFFLFALIFFVSGVGVGAASMLPIMILGSRALWQFFFWIRLNGGASRLRFIPAKITNWIDGFISRRLSPEGLQSFNINSATGLLALMPFLVVSALLGGVRITTVIFYFFFVSLRHRSDPVLYNVEQALTTVIRTKCPAFLVPYYDKLQRGISLLSRKVVPF